MIGLNPLAFNPHSFRWGKASWAFHSKVPGELIKVHGDWSSDAYLRYLDLSMNQKLSVAQNMIQALSSRKHIINY